MTSTPTMDLTRLELLAWAIEAAGRGWRVFPLRPGDKRPAGHAQKYCPGTGRCADGHKTPEQRATTDVDLLVAAWAHQPYNVAIATGPSGLLVVDLDMPKPQEPKGTPDGVDNFQALCERAEQPVPDTYRVRSARGGEHLYFTQPPGAALHSTAGHLAKKIDTRGWGGYVVAAGSTTPHGPYTVVDNRPPIELPDWLHNALKPPQRPAYALPNTPARAGGYAAAALRNEVRNVAAAADGTRNATLLRAARALGRLVASGDLTRTEVEEALSRAAGGNATQSQRYYDDVIRRGPGLVGCPQPSRRTRGMTIPTPTKSLTMADHRPNDAAQPADEPAEGEPKGAARKGVRTALGTDPHTVTAQEGRDA